MRQREAWRVARYRLRGTLRRSRGGLAAIVVLIGLVGGLAMASIQAARRTQAAYPVYLASTNPSDLVVTAYDAEGGPVANLAGAIARLPDVERLTTVYVPHVAVLTSQGAARVDVFDVVEPVASPDGLFERMDRLTPIRGRLADPRRIDEGVVDQNAARLLGLHVGSIVPLGVFTQAQASSSGFGSPRVQPIQRIEMHVVGVVDESSDVVQDDVDRAFGFIYLTPALLHDVLAIAPGGDSTPISYGLQLAGGAASVTKVEGEVRRILPAGAVSQFHVSSREVTTVELAMRPVSVALGGFGVVAALACLVLAMQALARVLRDEEEDRLVLRSLGASRLATIADTMIASLLAVVAGVALSIGFAVALSPLSPIGPVRIVYPDRGIAFDGPVYLCGAAVVLVTLVACAVVLAGRSTRHQGPSRASSRSAVGSVAVRAGMPIAGVVGVRFALEPGRDRRSVPFRSVLLGTVVALTLVVATLTFASSLQTLVSTPRLYGWNWNLALLPTNNMPASSVAMLDHDPDVAAWTGMDYNIVTIDGLAVPVLMEHGANNRVVPPVLSGHAVDGAGQIVVGAATLEELGRHVGQTVDVSYGSPNSGSLFLAPIPLRIVGTATFPAVGYASEVADHTSMGIGAMFSERSLPATFLRAAGSTDPNLEGAELDFVRLRAGVSPAAGRANLHQLAATVNRIYESDPNTSGNNVVLLGVQRPAQIVNYATVGTTPVVLAIVLALGALAALALTLVASVRRRRRELALLKALGFRPRQLAAAVAWQSTVAAVIGVVLGAPLGAVLGRQLWIVFARGLDAVPDPSVPLGSLLVVALGALVFANLVAFLPGRSAARTPTAAILRAD